MSDDRAVALARLASGLAVGAGIDLSDSLLLWGLAGGRPTEVEPLRRDDPAHALDRALEASLDHEERRRGAHHTPRPLADRVAAMAFGTLAGGACADHDDGRDDGRDDLSVVDPTCGGGALLLAAGRWLVDAGLPVDVVARDLLWGADVSPLAAAVTEAAITLWSRGTPPASGHVVAADTLLRGRATWPSSPADGFGALVGNPPFQGQLGRETTRSAAETRSLRERFGAVVTPYVDTAALFLLAGSELVRPGGAMAVILPQSVAASRDAAGVRAALAERAHLRELWAPQQQVFDADVHVCIAALDIRCRALHRTTAVRDMGAVPAPDPLHALGPSSATRSVAGRPHASAHPRAETTEVASASGDWAGGLAAAGGVPELALSSDAGTVADIAIAVAGFRDEYYGLVPHTREAGAHVEAPLATSGAIDIGSCSWGHLPIRFAKRRWARPEVDVKSLAKHNPKLAAWVARTRRPKVLVASQTRVVEAWADRLGTAVPVTPVVSVMPTGSHDVALMAAALCSPPVSAWAARRMAGTALSPGAMRVSAGLILAAPLPVDEAEWAAASEALEHLDLVTYARHATAMYRLPSDIAAAVVDWWTSNVPATARAQPGSPGLRNRRLFLLGNGQK